MFLVGKSSSISSNTWTPVLTCSVLVSVHPAFTTSTTNVLKGEFERNSETAIQLHVRRKIVYLALLAAKLTANVGILELKFHN